MEDPLPGGEALLRPPSNRADWLSWTQHHASMQQEEPLTDQSGQSPLPGERRPLPGTLEKLRRLLPNVRECQAVGNRLCYRSCDPFRLDADNARLLVDLGLRTIVDLRWGHERSEATDAAVYEFFDVVDWRQGQGRQLDGRVVFRVDFSASPQPEIRRFLGRDGPQASPKEADVGAFVGPVSQQRRQQRLAVDFVDCFASAIGSVFGLLADSSRYPVLLACPDGVLRCGVVCAIMQLLTREATDFVLDGHVTAQAELDEFHGVSEDLAAERREIARQTMQLLMRHVRDKYRTVEACLLHCGVSLQQIRQLKTV